MKILPYNKRSFGVLVTHFNKEGSRPIKGLGRGDFESRLWYISKKNVVLNVIEYLKIEYYLLREIPKKD